MAEQTSLSLRVAFANLGCRLNRVELDAMAEEFLHLGCTLVDQQEAQAVIVNSCIVTAEAQAKTRKTIRHLIKLSGNPYVFVTGCAAALFDKELKEISDKVRIVKDKKALPYEVISFFSKEKSALCDTAQNSALPLSPKSQTPTGRTRPGIKIQDGCNHRCTYCIVWKARGPARSLDPQTVLKAVDEASRHNAREVVLSGINLGSYSWKENSRSLRLPELLEFLLKRSSIERIRLSSIEPTDVDEHLLELIAAANGRIAPFLHISLQSGCDKTLLRMARPYTHSDYSRIVQMARSYIPDLALGCDLIVGFPQESDEDFEESLNFCAEMAFAKMHVFRYSKRPGTPAAVMDGQIDAAIKAERSQRARKLAEELRFKAARGCVGVEQRVLVQKPGMGVSGGLFDVAVDSRFESDQLVSVIPHKVLDNAILDARTS